MKEITVLASLCLTDDEYANLLNPNSSLSIETLLLASLYNDDGQCKLTGPFLLLPCR